MLFTFSGKQKKIQGLSAGKYYFDNEGGWAVISGTGGPQHKKTYLHPRKYKSCSKRIFCG